jgi:hypothetical protein
MRIYWLKRLSPKLGKEVGISSELHYFMRDHIKFIPWNKLKDSLIFQGDDKANISNEAFWQNQFYRIATEKFGAQNLFPEFGGDKKEGDGQSFYFNSDRKWMIEFFVGRHKRKLHYDKFNTHTGKYKDFEFNNFQLINIVFQKPGDVLQTYKGVSFLHFQAKDN